jgi:hypothetical protein
VIFDSEKMDFIERYFDEELSEEELRLFEQELECDSKFRDEVKQYEQVIGGLKDARFRKMKSEFRSFEDQIHSRKSEHTFFTKRMLSYCMALALLIGFVVFAVNYTISNPEIESKLIFEEYFRPYPNVIEPIKRSGSVEDFDLELVEVMELYESKQYDEAILGFDKLVLRSKELKNEMLFYKGVALLAKGDASGAANHFDLMDVSSRFANQRKWYLSLALVQIGEINEAKDSLNQIILDQSYFMVHAEEILNILSPKE